MGPGRREAGTGGGEARPRVARGWREAAVTVAAEPRRRGSRGGPAERTEGRGTSAGGPPEPRAGSCGGDRSRGVPCHGRGLQGRRWAGGQGGRLRAANTGLDVDVEAKPQGPVCLHVVAGPRNHRNRPPGSAPGGRAFQPPSRRPWLDRSVRPIAVRLRVKTRGSSPSEDSVAVRGA